MSYDEYSGKPSATLTLREGQTTRLDMHVPAPSGIDFGHASEDRLVYVNVTVHWRLTDKHHRDYYHQVANLRLDWMRVNDPDGETSYHDYTISPIKPSFLVTLTHWEHGRNGIGGYWEAQLTSPHATGATISASRYCKGRAVRLA